MSDLNTAIQLIRQGQKEQAQSILQAVIRNDQKNIQAWFWYVETCTTNESRIQALEACLKFTPGNSQATLALQKLRGNQPPVDLNLNRSFSVPPQSGPFNESPTPPSQSRSITQSYFQPSINESQKREPRQQESLTNTAFEHLQQTPPIKQVSGGKSWEADLRNFEDNSMLSKPNKPAKSYEFFDAWLTVMTINDIELYKDLLNDPKAGLERAFTWMACAGLLNGLVVPVTFMINPQIAEAMALPEFQDLTRSLDMRAFLVMLTVIMLFLAPLGSVLNLAISGGIQNLTAGFFGGSGNYTRTVYAIALFLAPMTILLSLASMISYIGQCFTLPLSIYNIILNVRALRASHSISNGAAVGVIMLPGLLVFIFICLILFLIGPSLPST